MNKAFQQEYFGNMFFLVLNILKFDPLLLILYFYFKKCVPSELQCPSAVEGSVKPMHSLLFAYTGGHVIRSKYKEKQIEKN